MKPLIALAAAALSFAVHAQTGTPPVTGAAPVRTEPTQDGFITLADFQKDVVASFHALDLDRDGYVTEAEVRAIPDARLARRMLRMLNTADSDKDRRLSFQEVVKARMAYFDEVDLDKDDRLSRDEVAAWQRGRASERARRLAAAEQAGGKPAAAPKK